MPRGKSLERACGLPGLPQQLNGKESACNALATGDAGSILGQDVPLEEGMATHSSVLACRISWTEEPGGLQSRGLQRGGRDSDLASTHVGCQTPFHCVSRAKQKCAPSFQVPQIPEEEWEWEWGAAPLFLALRDCCEELHGVQASQPAYREKTTGLGRLWREKCMLHYSVSACGVEGKVKATA